MSKGGDDDFVKVISVVRPLGKPKRLTGSRVAAKPVQMTLPLYPKPSPSSSSSSPITLSIPNLLTAELHSLLKMLPTELPRGSEDIYSSDVGLIWRSKDLDWCNMNMSMVAHGTPGTEGFDFDELTLAIGIMGPIANAKLVKAKNEQAAAEKNVSINEDDDDDADADDDDDEFTEIDAINHLNSGIGIGGSGGYVSLVKAKDEEKNMFKRVVQIVDTLVGIANGSIDPNSVTIIPYCKTVPSSSSSAPANHQEGKGKDVDSNMDEDAKDDAEVEMDVEIAETASNATSDTNSAEKSNGSKTRASTRNKSGKVQRLSTRKLAEKEKAEKTNAGRTVKRK